MNERIDFGKIIKEPKKSKTPIDRMKDNLDKAIDIIGGIGPLNTKVNRMKLYKSYDLLLLVQKDLRKLGD